MEEYEKIEEAADKLKKELLSKYGVGSNLRIEDVANWIKETFIQGADLGIKLTKK